MAGSRGSADLLPFLRERLRALTGPDGPATVQTAEHLELVEAFIKQEDRFAKVLAITDKYQAGERTLERLRRPPRAAQTPEAVLAVDPATEELAARLRSRLADPAAGTDEGFVRDVGLLLRRYEKLLARTNKIMAISDRYQAQLRELLARVDDLAHTDPLTGLLNRRAMMDKLEIEVARCERYGGLFSIALFDVDDFKAVNDTYGHDVGDEVLKSIADQFRQAVRRSDSCARWGGEEFLVLYTQTDIADALSGAEKCRAAIAALRVGERAIRVTTSGGAAVFRPGSEVSTLLREADRALYRAKAVGKDRVEG